MVFTARLALMRFFIFFSFTENSSTIHELTAYKIVFYFKATAKSKLIQSTLQQH